MEAEFYTTPEGDVLVRRKGQIEKVLKETDTDIIEALLTIIQEFYPKAYAALYESYHKSIPNRPYHRFLMARRFLKCNMSAFDNVIDLTSNTFKFEFVQCPLRGECKFEKVICSPSYCTSLSERELQVMKCLYKGASVEETADILYISANTVENHRRNVYKKLRIHSLAEFTRFASDTNIYKQ